jgi:hypothetical protein
LYGALGGRKFLFVVGIRGIPAPTPERARRAGNVGGGGFADMSTEPVTIFV